MKMELTPPGGRVILRLGKRKLGSDLFVARALELGMFFKPSFGGASWKIVPIVAAVGSDSVRAP